MLKQKYNLGLVIFQSATELNFLILQRSAKMTDGSYQRRCKD